MTLRGNKYQIGWLQRTYIKQHKVAENETAGDIDRYMHARFYTSHQAGKTEVNLGEGRILYYRKLNANYN